MDKFWVRSLIVFLSLSLIYGETDVESAQTFIIRVQSDLKPSVFSDIKHWYTSILLNLTSIPLHSETTQTQIHKHFLHVYNTIFHGFSIKLTTQQAQQLKKRPEVVAVLPDQFHRVQTTRSPQFLGLTSTNRPRLLTLSDFGSNIIIGMLDTGIWPERSSFHDKGLGPIPSNWKGECTEGEKFTRNLCNKKIIGARYFNAGYKARNGRIKGTISIKSPRDSEGHGTHTSSIAAGRAVANASHFGFAKGVAVGIAPKAKIAVYKVCWEGSCADSDILSAFDKAIEDGVDIISISIVGGTAPYNEDSISIGSFAAMERGILVSASAGNEGPTRMSVINEAPWITTVGASTIDRSFPADLVLEDGRGIAGASLYSGKSLTEKTYLPLIYARNASVDIKHGVNHGDSDSAATCMPDSLDKELVRGKIVVCEQGDITDVAKGQIVKEVGGIGMVVANKAPLGDGLIAESHLIPTVAITESAGHRVRDYIHSSQNPKAMMVFGDTHVGVKPAPVVASFSSRGPSTQSIYVLKPDVIAPGVNILAAWPDGVGPTDLYIDTRRTEFNIESGTSMSCPHVSGVAALLKGVHPDWSPAMIRSALMTTAYMQDGDGKPLLDEKSYKVAKVWDMGAGHIDPEKAVDPGLVYDLKVNDYLEFLCASSYSRRSIRQLTRRSIRCTAKQHKPWNLNYPAISIAFNASESSNSEVVVKRTVTHVVDGASSYTVIVTNPKGVTVTVDPTKMNFGAKGQKQSYIVRVKAEKKEVPPGNSVTKLGKLIWTDGKHQVVSPLIVVWQKGF